MSKPRSPLRRPGPKRHPGLGAGERWRSRLFSASNVSQSGRPIGCGSNLDKIVKSKFRENSTRCTNANVEFPHITAFFCLIKAVVQGDGN